jgi:hypothetical protein
LEARFWRVFFHGDHCLPVTPSAQDIHEEQNVSRPGDDRFHGAGSGFHQGGEIGKRQDIPALMDGGAVGKAP